MLFRPILGLVGPKCRYCDQRSDIEWVLGEASLVFLFMILPLHQSIIQRWKSNFQIEVGNHFASSKLCGAVVSGLRLGLPDRRVRKQQVLHVGFRVALIICFVDIVWIWAKSSSSSKAFLSLRISSTGCQVLPVSFWWRLHLLPIGLRVLHLRSLASLARLSAAELCEANVHRDLRFLAASSTLHMIK